MIFNHLTTLATFDIWIITTKKSRKTKSPQNKRICNHGSWYLKSWFDWSSNFKYFVALVKRLEFGYWVDSPLNICFLFGWIKIHNRLYRLPITFTNTQHVSRLLNPTHFAYICANIIDIYEHHLWLLKSLKFS